MGKSKTPNKIYTKSNGMEFDRVGCGEEADEALSSRSSRFESSLVSSAGKSTRRTCCWAMAGICGKLCARTTDRACYSRKGAETIPTKVRAT